MNEERLNKLKAVNRGVGRRLFFCGAARKWFSRPLVFLQVFLQIIYCALAHSAVESPQQASYSVDVKWQVAPEKSEWVEKTVIPVTDEELSGAGAAPGASFKKGENTFMFDVPVLLKNEDTWFPIKSISKNLLLNLITMAKDRIVLIRDDGLPLEITFKSKDIIVNRRPFLTLNHPIYRHDSEPYIELGDISALFDKKFVWEAAQKTLALEEPVEAQSFQVFSKPKPKEMMEERYEIPAPPISPAMEQFTEKMLLPAPASVQPDIKLHLSQYGSYTHDNLTKNRTRSYSVITGGYAYDYKFDSYMRWLDQTTGPLVNDGKYLAFYGKDIWFRALDLSASLYPLRSQSQGYEGFSVTQFRKPMSATYYFGRNNITIPGPADVGSVKYYGKLAGIQEELDLGYLDLKGDLLYIYNEAESNEKRGRIDFPRRNLVAKGDATLNLPYDIRVATQGAVSNYNPDNQKDEIIRDYNWRFEADMRKSLFSAGYLSEYVGTSYASLGYPSNYQDYFGQRVYFNLRPFRFLSLDSSYYVSQDNVDNLPYEPTVDNTLLIAGATLTLPDESYLGYTFDRSFSETTGPGFEYVEALGSNSYSHMFTYSKSWGQEWSVYGSYTRSNTDSFGSDNDYWSDRYEVSMYRFIPRFKGSYLRLRHQFQKNWYMASGNFTTIFNNSSVGLRFYPVPQIYFYTDWDINSTEAENIEDTAILGCRAGFNASLTNDIQFGVDYFFNPTDVVRFSNKSYNNWQVLFKGQLGFDWGTGEKWAKVNGSVFVDSNLNGKRDPGEDGVKDVIISVPKEVVAKTDEKGYYKIKHVIPGMKALKLDDKTLPFGLGLVDRNELVFEAKKYQKTQVDFALIKVGSVGGRLYVDENENGAYEKGEEGLEEVNVYLNGTYRNVLTDANGRFLFELLPPGKYIITFKKENIPPHYDLKSLNEVTVEVRQGEAIENLLVPVYRREVVKKVF